MTSSASSQQTPANATRATRSRRAWALVLAVLVSGAALSATSATLWTRSQRADEHRSFEAAAQNVTATLGTLIGRDVDFVATLRTVLAMRPGLSPTKFNAWYRRLQGSQRQVGGLGSAVITVVPSSRLLAFQARRDADRAFQATAGPWVRFLMPDGRRRYCLVSAGNTAERLTPFAGHVLQEDWCGPNSIVGRWQNPMLHASAAADRLLVEPIRLPWVRTTILVLPFYRRGVPLRTPAQRLASTRGWVISSFDTPVLAREAIGGNPGLSATVRFVNPDGRSVAVIGDGEIGRAALVRRTEIRIDGRWTIAVAGVPVANGISADTGGALVLAGGLALTVLLSLLILTLSRSRERALAMVAEKTAQLRHQALHDALTGLPNRVLAIDRAEQMLARARRAQLPIAVLYIDIDGFKHINDTFGHAAGDALLRAVADRIRRAVRDGDTAARLAGDEFVVLLDPSAFDAAPELVAERLLAVLREPYEMADAIGRDLRLTASIGVAHGRECTAEQLLGDADVALYAAKEAGRDRFVVFESGMQTAAQDRVALEMDLGDALAGDQLFLDYQPIFDLGTERIVGVEALARWCHPRRGPIGPDVFIPIAERSGQILAIGRWVMRAACLQAARWREMGYDLGVAVNVSGRQLDHDDLVDEVRAALSDAALESSSLTLEVTETALMRDPAASARRLQTLKDLGVRVAIDDFGSGYSSLSHLRRLPVDMIKIDRAFVSGIGTSPQAAALIRTLIDLGRSLSLVTVAEGIEEGDQLLALVGAGCDRGQGFLLGRPAAAEELTRRLGDRPDAHRRALATEAS